MSMYIGTMPISQDGPCAVEQISAARSSLTTIDNKAIIPKVGAAARAQPLRLPVDVMACSGPRARRVIHVAVCTARP